MPLTPAEADKKYDAWLADLERIDSELTHVLMYRQIWREVHEMAEAAGVSANPGLFFLAFDNWYLSAQLLAVRRQADVNHGVVSLRRLIDDVASHPEVMDRSRYTALWPSDDQLSAHRRFDELAGSRLDRVPRSRTKTNRDRLDAATEKTKHYVDNEIAHTNRHGAKRWPTRSELDEALDEVADVYRFYKHLLRNSDFGEPHLEGAWHLAFAVPWWPPAQSQRR